jgi:hypothetical protein
MDKKAEKAALVQYTDALQSKLLAEVEPAAALSLALPLLLSGVRYTDGTVANRDVRDFG